MLLSPNLNGADNFRDIGGILNANSRAIKFGRVYRSQSLHTLTDTDLDELRALNFRLVFDLRSRRERTSHPSRWPLGAPTLHVKLDVTADIRAQNRALLDILSSSPSACSAQQMMLASYRLFPTTFAEPLTRLFSHILPSDAEPQLPALIHCSAGKDRTGFVIAIILSALNVSWDGIMRDYMRTESCTNKERLIHDTRGALETLLGFVPNYEVLTTLAGLTPDYLSAAFETIENRYGSVDNYLAMACGLTPPARRRFCDAMLS